MLDLRTEEELMLAAREGDDDAFRALVLCLRKVVGRFLRHLGCDEVTVEDLAQETLLRLWSARGRYQQRAALRTYVLTIAKNLWLTHCRREVPGIASGQRRQTSLGSIDELDNLVARSRQWPPGPEMRLLEEYRAHWLRQAIASLPERQRLVFVLAHLEDLPYGTIAGMLGIAEGTVKSRMSRAVRNLRSMLEGEYP